LKKNVIYLGIFFKSMKTKQQESKKKEILNKSDMYIYKVGERITV